jgi:hypothetical protein
VASFSNAAFQDFGMRTPATTLGSERDIGGLPGLFPEVAISLLYTLTFRVSIHNSRSENLPTSLLSRPAFFIFCVTR